MKPTTRTLLPLAGAALAYSLAQTMVIPALPELQAEFHANPADATWLLTAFLLTSSVATPLLGRLGDMHGKERWLLISLAIFGVGSLDRRPRRLAGRPHHRAGRAGRGRRDLPARHRHHPRRVPARARGARHRHGVGHVRDRRRDRARARRPLRRPRLDLVDLLALGRDHGAGRARDLALGARVARARARAHRLGRRRAAVAHAHRVAAADQRGQHVGLDLGARPRAVRGDGGPRRGVGALGAARRRPAREPRAHARASGVDDERRRLRHRLRDVRLLRADPPVRADAVLGRLRLRRHGDRVGALPAPLGPAHALRRAVQRAPRRALRLARAARARRAVLRAELRLAGDLPRRAHRHLLRERPARARGRDGPGGDGQPGRRGRAPRRDRRGQRHQRDHAHHRRRRRRPGGGRDRQRVARRRRALSGRVGLHRRLHHERAGLARRPARLLRHPLARGRARAHAGDRRRPRRREQPR